MRVTNAIWIAILFSLITACSMVDYKTLPESQQEVVKVEDIKMDKDSLYSAIQQWFAANLGKSNEAIQIQDKDAGILLGRVIVPNGLRDVLGVRHDLQMSVKVEVKEEKYRITVSEFRFYYQGSGRYVSTGSEHESSLETASKLTSDIFTHVNSINNNSSF